MKKALRAALAAAALALFNVSCAAEKTSESSKDVWQIKANSFKQELDKWWTGLRQFRAELRLAPQTIGSAAKDMTESPEDYMGRIQRELQNSEKDPSSY